MANDLEKYYEEIQGLTGFNPAKVKESGEEVMRVVRDRNDPTAWMAYAAETMKSAWMALPHDFRNQFLADIDDVIRAALDESESISNFLGKITEGANAVPIIGWVIEAVLVVVKLISTAWKVVDTSKKQSRTRFKRQRMFDTVDNYKDPRDWVYKKMNVVNYAYYVKVRTGGDFSLEPSFRRSTTTTSYMFSTSPAPSDSGRCSRDDGVQLDCTVGGKVPYSDVNCKRYPERDSNPNDPCKRVLGVSALFYPYWSPTYPVGPIQVAMNKGEQYDPEDDPNVVLIARQTMMLTDPYTNLRVRGADVRRASDRFVDYWHTMINNLKVGGRSALMRIDEHGNALSTDREDRYTIDEKKDPDHTGSDLLKNRFYFDADGRIFSYPGMADLNEWGIRCWGGDGKGHGGGYMGCTVGAYNAVVTNTLAFFTARANMLRNGPRMKGVIQDHRGVRRLDPEVRHAVQYAADKGKMLPGPAVVVFKVLGAGRKTLAPPRYSPGGVRTREKEASGGGVVVVGVAAVAGLLAWLRFR